MVEKYPGNAEMTDTFLRLPPKEIKRLTSVMFLRPQPSTLHGKTESYHRLLRVYVQNTALMASIRPRSLSSFSKNTFKQQLLTFITAAVGGKVKHLVKLLGKKKQSGDFEKKIINFTRIK